MAPRFDSSVMAARGGKRKPFFFLLPPSSSSSFKGVALILNIHEDNYVSSFIYSESTAELAG